MMIPRSTKLKSGSFSQVLIEVFLDGFDRKPKDDEKGFFSGMA
jgi:hypothetical protein